MQINFSVFSLLWYTHFISMKKKKKKTASICSTVWWRLQRQPAAASDEEWAWMCPLLPGNLLRKMQGDTESLLLRIYNQENGGKLNTEPMSVILRQQRKRNVIYVKLEVGGRGSLGTDNA